MADSKKYYEILGVPTTATKDEINIAFRKKAKECHPDLVPEREREAAAEKFKKLNEAQEILCDENKRAAYDNEMPSFDSNINNGFNGFDFNNPFANMNGTYNYGQKVVQNPVIVDMFQAMYSNNSSTPKSTEDILQRKNGGR